MSAFRVTVPAERVSLSAPSALVETARRVMDDPELWERAHRELDAFVEAAEAARDLIEARPEGATVPEWSVPSWRRVVIALERFGR